MEFKVQKLREGAVLPRRATRGSAGYDLCLCSDMPLTIWPGEVRPAHTGIAIELPHGCVGLVFGRSGLAVNHGITPANAVGVIDSDYRGEIIVGLRNLSSEPYTMQPGERIAQLVMTPVLTPEVEERGSLSNTERGQGGFGSTGR